MPTPSAAPSRTKQLVFFGILATAGALVSLLTVYKLSVANAYRIFVDETPLVAIPSDAANVVWGTHLLRDVLACSSCHGADWGGQVLRDDAWAVVTAPNLTTPQRSDETWVRALRLGVDGEGRGLWMMPSRAHSILNDRDLGAIVAAVRAAQPVLRLLPQSHLRFWGNWAVASRQLRLIQTSEQRTQPFDAGTPVRPDAAFGGYLSQLMQCTSCHAAPTSPTPSGAPVMGAGALLDAYAFGDAARQAHPPQKRPRNAIAMPTEGLQKLTYMEFEALWRYFKGA